MKIKQNWGLIIFKEKLAHDGMEAFDEKEYQQ